MTTNELTAEKRIADDCSHPPVHPESALNRANPDTILGRPPQTQLLLGGFDRNEISADFLVGIHDLADEYTLDLESISVNRR